MHIIPIFMESANTCMRMRIVYCNTCNENLGEERPNWAVEHMKKHSDHRSYRGRIE